MAGRADCLKQLNACVPSKNVFFFCQGTAVLLNPVCV